MMKWWLGRPDGVAAWASSSGASAMALVGAWTIAWSLFIFEQTGDIAPSVLWNLACLAAVGTHGLLWWQVGRGVWAFCRDAAAGPGWPLAIAVLWWVALLLFQLLSLQPVYALLFLTIAGSGP
jgi:hypothetical protein